MSTLLMEYICVVFLLEYQAKVIVCQEGKVLPGIPYILMQTLKIPQDKTGKSERKIDWGNGSGVAVEP